MASENGAVFASRADRSVSSGCLPVYEVHSTLEHRNSRIASNAQAQRHISQSDERTKRGIVPKDAVGFEAGRPYRVPQDAEEAAARRYHAAQWLQTMVGPLNLPNEPTEEDLLLSLRDGRVLCSLMSKIKPGFVAQNFERGSHWDSSSASSNNLRRFLAAAAEMKLPVFEDSDLDESDDVSSSSERVVDCLLSLKCCCELKESGDSDYWKYDGVSHSCSKSKTSSREVLALPSSATAKSNGQLAVSTQKSPFQPRRRWVIPEFEDVGEADMPFADDSTTLQGQNVGSPQYTNSLHAPRGWNDSLADENHFPNCGQRGTGLTSTHIHHISQKFREILRLKTKGAMHDSMTSENSTVLRSLENSSSQSLSSLVSAILGDQQQEEVPALVEFMLRKVMEEFERRLLTQSDQVTKLKNVLKEQLMKEVRLNSRTRVLETLAAGTGEEVKILSSQLLKMKMENKKAEEDKKTKEVLMEKLLKERKEHEKMVEALQKELEVVKHKDSERFQELELQKEKLEQEMQAKLNGLEDLLEESKKKVDQLEASSAVGMQVLKARDEQYQQFILSQQQSLQDCKTVSEATRQQVVLLQDAWQRESEALEIQLQGLVQAASGYHKVLAENRDLYNEVQDLKGNIRVYCRVRPFLPGQAAKQGSVDFVGENGDILITNSIKQGKDGHKMFNFNKVFKTSATQEEVFLDTQSLIRSVLDGYNVCIFAYGQTGSGKTYTMSGPNSTSQQDWGVNYRALNDLFHISQSRIDVFTYEVGVQMIEIYNEQVRDLLYIDNPNRRLEIRNNSQLNGLNVPDASMLPVNSTSDVFELMKIGQKNRAIGATALNERSSRSHSVLTVHVKGTELASGLTLRGCLHLVDLAGSERVERSEATGERLKEAQHINKSLSALGDVIAALAQKSTHIPYRNSKLTQLLQDSLGGQAKTLMFVHISPDIESYGETISTLKFAERVATVELGAARSNKESRELHDLKEQVAIMKEMMAKKDGETDRLQNMQIPGNENIAGFEKSKSKLTSGASFYKPVVEVQQKKMRRQTVDMAGQKERQIIGGLHRDTGSQGSETSLSSSPRESRKPQSRIMKDGQGMLVDIKDIGQAGRLENRILDTDADLQNMKWKENHGVAMEPELLPMDWRDRIQSSSDSSLFGMASLDDIPIVWDAIHTEKSDVPNSVVASSHLRSMIEKDRNMHVMKLQEPSLQDSCETQIETVLGPFEDDRSRSNSYVSDGVQKRMHMETNRRCARDLDTGSEISDGDISLVETEVSMASAAEQTIRKGNLKSERHIPGQRKQPQLLIPHPVRGEWKTLKSGQSQVRPRRHSTAVSPAQGSEQSFSKRQPSLGPKHSIDGGASSFMSDGGSHLSGQNIYKASKRWL